MCALLRAVGVKRGRHRRRSTAVLCKGPVKNARTSAFKAADEFIERSTGRSKRDNSAAARDSNRGDRAKQVKLVQTSPTHGPVGQLAFIQLQHITEILGARDESRETRYTGGRRAVSTIEKLGALCATH